MRDKKLPDILVAGCGLTTCLLTALTLWWIEQRFGFAAYTLMLWLVIPAGAIFSGLVGASGYYAGCLWVDLRPTRLLFLNVISSSVSTFFFIHYLSYVALRIEGNPVRNYLSFWQYLNVAIRSASLEFRVPSTTIGSTREMGSFGYALALVQILGFAVGGMAVCGYLAEQPYCERCSRYLSGKARQIRYAENEHGLQSCAANVLEDLRNGAIGSAVERQNAFGTPIHQKGNRLRSVFETRHCGRCGRGWVKFAAELKNNDNWREISGLTFSGFTDSSSISLDRVRV